MGRGPKTIGEGCALSDPLFSTRSPSRTRSPVQVALEIEIRSQNVIEFVRLVSRSGINKVERYRALIEHRVPTVQSVV